MTTETQNQNETTAPDAKRRTVKRLVSFLRKESKWVVVRIPAFALLLLMFYLISPGEMLALWQVVVSTWIVMLVRDYLNWVEKRYRS